MSKTIYDISSEIGSGITPLRSNSAYWDSRDVPWIKTEQLGQYQIFDANEYISKTALEETSIKLWPPKTVSVAMYGEGKTRGNASILMMHSTTNQACCNIVANPYKADYRFLYYWLKNNYEQLRTLAAGVRKNLNSDDIKSFPFPDVNVTEQTKIADVLSSIDNAIQNNNLICNELESMSKTLYDYWFTQFDFPNEEGKPYRSSDGEMVWNEQLKQEIPRGWNCSVIANHIGNSKSGDWGKESATGNYLKEVICIRGADFPSINENKTLSAPTRYILEKNANKVLSSGDIIVEISGGSPTQSTGRICYINENTIRRFDKDIITSNFCRAFSTKKKAEQYWLYLLWKTLYDAGVLFGFEGKTTGIKNLLFDDFCAQYKIVCPEEDILEKFHKIVSPIFEKMQQYNIENDELTKLRDWLLPMLMNGQATVE